MKRHPLLFWLLLLLAAGATAPPMSARAHKVTVFAWVEGDMIHTESQFSAGRKVRKGQIEVQDKAGSILVSGTTDEQGRFSFPIPRHGGSNPGDLKIVLKAGEGHFNEWVVPASEMTGAVGAAGVAAGDAAAKSDTASVQAQAGSQAGNESRTAWLSEGRIERVVESAVERKLAPLRAQLADSPWGLRDVVGGIGYILGLMGLASWIHYRRHTGVKP